MTVPSRGHRHSTYDLWRFYPRQHACLAACAELELLRARTDWPPRKPASKRHDYAAIDARESYWGDTSAVFRKPKGKPSARFLVNRYVTLRFANGIGDLSSVPLPKRGRSRRRPSAEKTQQPEDAQ